MNALIETGKDGGYIIEIGDDTFVRQTLNEVGEVLEDAFGEEADFDNIPEGDEGEYTYRFSPFGVLRTKIVPSATKADWDAQQAATAEKATARKAKIAADKAAAIAQAEADELAELDALEKAAAAWQLKYPNKRRSETKPTEDPGEGWEWTNEGICSNCWTRIKVGR